MSLSHYQSLARLEARIGYEFQDKDLAVSALTHASFGDGRRKVKDNENLEFLGDRVLGLMTAQALYNIEGNDEGVMARQLNALVRKEACADVARDINLGDALRISSSENRQGGRDKVSILGDACEALIAAIYIDGGLEAAQKFYQDFWIERLEIVANDTNKDPKTELQEKASANGGYVPIYNMVERSGPDHRPRFIVEVSVETLGSARGTGRSKKDAERFAARHLLEKMKSEASA